uniref:Uncharacterized protein n=1 Tax=Trichogramma kaykai TaxID=54128 RepID=A0ABD2XPP9_9HYME
MTSKIKEALKSVLLAPAWADPTQSRLDEKRRALHTRDRSPLIVYPSSCAVISLYPFSQERMKKYRYLWAAAAAAASSRGARISSNSQLIRRAIYFQCDIINVIF